MRCAYHRIQGVLIRDVFSGSTIINLYDDHMEFISLGGLVRGISMEAIFMGASQSRNPKLADIFYRFGPVESYGTGIRKILRLYEGLSAAPVFHAAEYRNIGIHRIERMLRSPNCPFVLFVGTKGQLGERWEFEEYIQNKLVIWWFAVLRKITLFDIIPCCSLFFSV